MAGVLRELAHEMCLRKAPASAAAAWAWVVPVSMTATAVLAWWGAL